VMRPALREGEQAVTAPVDYALGDLRAAAGRFFSDPSVRAEPASFYSRLVREAPILDLGHLWLVSGFDEIACLLAHRELRSFPSVGGRVVPMTLVPSLATWLALMLPVSDGARHRRLRQLAAATFSPSRIASLEALIEENVDAILDQASVAGTMDIVADLALPLPLAISTAMLDIPLDDRAYVHEWALLVRRQLLCYSQDAAEVAVVEGELRECVSYIRSLCKVRRDHPGEDLISDLVSAADAGQLSNDELIAYVLMLFVNGLETLTAGLTMAVWELLQRPDQRTAVSRDRNYAKAVFDEAIRLHTPVRFSARTLAADIRIAGHRLCQGDVVALFFSAANRDPRRFAEPDQFAPARQRGRHLGFGYGGHYCLGASLSLFVGAIVLQRLAQLHGPVTTDVTPATALWSSALAYNTLASLPIRIGHG
jgi:cytochrome P450